MKKCKQCGMLSADTANVCRHCNSKFTEDDKPIVITESNKKSKKGTITAIIVIIAIIGIAVFSLYKSGMFETWFQSSVKSDLNVIATEFIEADFKEDAQAVKIYMFDEYISYHSHHGTFSLQQDQYKSIYFSSYDADCSIEVLSVTIELLDETFEIYYNDISGKYNVQPTEIASVLVEVKITDGELSLTTIAPLTTIKLNNEWFVLPIL